MGGAVTAVRMGTGPQIMLASGNWFDFKDPWNSEFTIEDIAQGLSNLCRYAGQCRQFYSVAEHSLQVAALVPEYPLEALLHDAAEAFLGDITRPLKQLLPDFQRIEREIEAVIQYRFRLDSRARDVVKKADLRVLAAEQAQIMPLGTDEWISAAGVVPASINICHIHPEVAQQAFLSAFHAHWSARQSGQMVRRTA
jgi:hypothetical protein